MQIHCLYTYILILALFGCGEKEKVVYIEVPEKTSEKKSENNSNSAGNSQGLSDSSGDNSEVPNQNRSLNLYEKRALEILKQLKSESPNPKIIRKKISLNSSLQNDKRSVLVLGERFIPVDLFWNQKLLKTLSVKKATNESLELEASEHYFKFLTEFPELEFLPRKKLQGIFTVLEPLFKNVVAWSEGKKHLTPIDDNYLSYDILFQNLANLNYQVSFFDLRSKVSCDEDSYDNLVSNLNNLIDTLNVDKVVVDSKTILEISKKCFQKINGLFLKRLASENSLVVFSFPFELNHVSQYSTKRFRSRQETLTAFPLLCRDQGINFFKSATFDQKELSQEDLNSGDDIFSYTSLSSRFSNVRRCVDSFYAAKKMNYFYFQQGLFNTKSAVNRFDSSISLFRQVDQVTGNKKITRINDFLDLRKSIERKIQKVAQPNTLKSI